MNNNIPITKAIADDLQEILDLQKLAYTSEAELYEDFTIQPLRQTNAFQFSTTKAAN